MHLYPVLAAPVFCFLRTTWAVPTSLYNGTLFDLKVIKIRIEGATRTIFEGLVLTGPHAVTTASGGTHHCDGTNDGANQFPGPTCTTALDSAAREGHFTFDGTYSAEFDDFFITRIGSTTQTATQFWGLLVDFVFTPVGGCQEIVETGPEVLWAFDAFNKKYFLKLNGPSLAHADEAFNVTVTDGMTGVPIEGAQVHGAVSDAGGVAHITASHPGVLSLKATRDDSIRSNAISVVIF